MANQCTRHEMECAECEWAESTLDETKEYIIETLVRKNALIFTVELECSVDIHLRNYKGPKLQSVHPNARRN
jgi:hypothetical protein